MAQMLLHGTLHATIFEAASLSNPHRASGSAPKFIRKVRTLLLNLLVFALALFLFCPFLVCAFA
jgi:hypothetical protein